MPTCLACGHADTARWAEALDEEYHTTSEAFTYYRCNRCCVLFIDPVPRDALATIYPSNYYSFDGKLTRSALFRVKDWLDRRFFARFVRALAGERLSVLDVGGGAGTQLSSFRNVDPRIARTAVVDIDPKAQEVARSRGHEYFCGRFEDYETQGTFDVILMLNLIEHVENPGELLAKARSLLTPQGLLIVKTPNTDSLDARLFRHRNWGGFHCPRHWVLFDRQNFSELVVKSGLSIRHFQYTQGAPFWTTSVMFALARRKWIAVSAERPVPTHPLYSPLSAAFAGFDMVRGMLARTSQMFVVMGRA